jgi:hypothetical protein
MESISWTTFMMTTTLLVVTYYLIVFIYCYGPALSKIIPKGSDDHYNPLFIRENETDESPENAVETNDWQEPEPEIQEVDSLIEELKEGIGFAADHEYQPLAFKAHLASIINKFPNLKDSVFQPAINELIVKESKAYGLVVLSEEEAMHLWNSH